MADRIYLHLSDLPTGSLKSGKSKIDDAVSKLYSLTHQAASPIDSVYYSVNGEWHRLFTSGAAGIVANCCAEIQNLQLQIETYLSILKSGPAELEQIDRAAKNELTSWLDRFLNSLGGAFSSNTNINSGSYTWLFVPGRATGLSTTVPTPSERNKKKEQDQKQDENKQKSEKPSPEWKVTGGTIISAPSAQKGGVCEAPEDTTNRSTLAELFETMKNRTQEVINSFSHDITRIGQNQNAKDCYDSALWGKYDNTSSRCNVACALMAMQQLLGERKLTETLGSSAWGEVIMDYNKGKNGTAHSPAWIPSYSGVANLAGLEAKTSSYSESSLDSLISNYQTNPGIYSAPVVGVQYGTEKYHYVMVVGKNPDGTYQIVDPAGWNQQTLKYTSDASKYSTQSNGQFTGKITQVIQYYKET